MAESEKPRMAGTIRIVRDGIGKPARMYIDGEFFPYFTQDGFSVHPQRGELPQVTLTLVAEQVEVLDNWGHGPGEPG